MRNTDVKKLYPDLPIEEQLKLKHFFEEYLKLALRIVRRIELERSLTDEAKSPRMKSSTTL